MSSSTPAGVPPAPGPFEPTGVPHLDYVLGGGLRKGSLAIIMGPPGSGKTTLASQIAFSVAQRGQRTLFLTAFSESTTKLLEHLQTYSFFSGDLIGNSVQIFSLKQFLSTTEPGNLAAQEIVATVRQTQANMVVLDGFQGLRDMETSVASTRQLLYDLGVRLSLLGTTTIITTEADPRDPTLFPEMTTGDVLIGLYYTLVDMRSFRMLEVIKVRGSSPVSGRHSLRLSEQGVEVFPRLESFIKQPAPGIQPEHLATRQTIARVAFGLAELDTLLNGGLPQNTCTLLAGSLGTGKTLLALQFAMERVSQQEPVLYLGFRETVAQLLIKADDFALGAQLRQALASDGLLTLQRWEPVELDPDRVMADLFALLEQTGARYLIIDSILELTRAIQESSGGGRIATFLGALLATLRERHVTVLAIEEIRKGIATQPDFSVDPLAVLAENVLLLQHLAYRNRLHRVLSILKMRFSLHDHAFREFHIVAPQGIHVLTLAESGADILEGLTNFHETGGWSIIPYSGNEKASER
jgi:circadian clock protein KaiC